MPTIIVIVRELELHEPNWSSPLMITSSLGHWKAVSPLMNW